MKIYSALIAVLFICKMVAQPNMDSAQISTIKINDHIHLLQWSGAGNMMLLSGTDGNILVDDQFAPLSTKINSAIQAVNKGNVRFLLNTHFHGDHTGGNANFAKMGATIMAHENVRARLSADQRIMNFGPNQKAEPREAWPVITFKNDVSIFLNNEDVLAIHIDNAHTDGDVLYYLPKSNVLHTGDTYMKDRFPFIDRNSGGSVAGEIAGISKVLALIDDQTVIIPGHGALASKKDLRNFRDVVMNVYDAVRAKVKSGADLATIKGMNLTKDYDTNFGSGFIKSDAFVTTIFNELTGQK